MSFQNVTTFVGSTATIQFSHFVIRSNLDYLRWANTEQWVDCSSIGVTRERGRERTIEQSTYGNRMMGKMVDGRHWTGYSWWIYIEWNSSFSQTIEKKSLPARCGTVRSKASICSRREAQFPVAKLSIYARRSLRATVFELLNNLGRICL